ncbi:MAG: N-acetylmannosaminyltransferase [Candidatus Collierbacteria bacterium GW2011_GWC2_44_18]|uniref:N-acetylmannosaminyltransferase n=1 Tax=Candidatus Collierbacteria bacterium GW2011_GWC2_44_18 TaxID=1618392 RepID=A0A0G1HMT5_9BACT|nr:MAG: N-acetylmannosaminyltransferase [Candidatus Collierbacteria bacterium GW2011_GWC2_44_18]
MGIPVDILNRKETIAIIDGWLKRPGKKARQVVTAYSEFFVTAQSDIVFRDVMRKADLVTPDGVSVLAAVEYLKRTQTKGGFFILKCFAEGLNVGRKILSSRIGETVTGVRLFEELNALAERRGWKVFLLGGWGDVGSRTATMLLERFPRLRVMFDAGENRVGTDRAADDRVTKKINAWKPDILFVQYNPVKQEKWIASHLSRLKVGMAMGVGGTFNEFLGEFKKAPVWMEKSGLKWLWRVIVEPQRFGRIFRGVIVFPWMVFQESLKRKN